MAERPSLRALLRRDYPARVAGVFTLLFGVGALVPLAAAPLVADGEDRRFCLFFAGCFGVFVIGCCTYFLRRMSWIRRLTERGVVVDGRVLVVDQNSEDVWYMIVGYEWDGVPHRAWQGTGDKSKFQPGDTVRLLVDPARPDKAWPAES